ncbi:hypothetical protein [Curtobacterium sp. VKM Ac-1376]|uniref:hypothetical protein n=1 Tax=Curtobacterium sp. VKM Ac-1376 TaxID=123312 RepID=UPI00188D6323|nr:hypothetical protein [Curtobacterium sp. VKM Ac-1376]MBF4614253.1 hypothetical protein [Curtobacterium sp. VKM Ac-1376]
MRRTRVVVAVVGVSVVTLYAALLAVNALVLDPLGAVPGATLAEIDRHLDAQGFHVQTDIVVVIALASVGVVLAVVLSVLLLVTRAPTHVIAAVLLAVVVLGGPASFWSGFALGMDVADGFGTDGGDHTIWAGVLYVTSLVALVALPFVLVIGQARHVRRTTLRARAA